MEVYAQEITATYDKGYEKDRQLCEVLYLVCPESLLMGSTKIYGCPSDLKGLPVVLEKQEGVWAVV